MIFFTFLVDCLALVPTDLRIRSFFSVKNYSSLEEIITRGLYQDIIYIYIDSALLYVLFVVFVFGSGSGKIMRIRSDSDPPQHKGVSV